MIWIDVHEAASLKQQLIQQAAKSDLAIPVEETGLPVADFVFPHKSVAIEHKRWPDFVGSMVSGRLKEQIYNMKENYQNVFVIISGSREDLKESNIHRHSISGGIVSLAAKYRVGILWAVDDEDIAYQVLNLYEKIDKPLKPFSEVAKRLEFSDKQIKVAMLATIPGFGEKRAKALLEATNWDMRKIANLNTDNIFEIEGMTEGMAFNLLKIFSTDRKE